VQCPHCQHTFVADTGSISADPPAIPYASSSERRRRRYDEDDERDTLDDLDVRKPGGPMPHNYIVESVLVMLCCCQLFGIIALVHGIQVSSHYQRGDYDKALQASETAKKWCIWGALLGPIAAIILVAIQIMAETRR
jgi:hypothetical protein